MWGWVCVFRMGGHFKQRKDVVLFVENDSVSIQAPGKTKRPLSAVPRSQKEEQAESSASWPWRSQPPLLLALLAQEWPYSLPRWPSSHPIRPHAGSHLLLLLSFPPSNLQDLRMSWLFHVTLAQTLLFWWVSRRLACGTLRSPDPCFLQRDSWPGKLHMKTQPGRSHQCVAVHVLPRTKSEQDFLPSGHWCFKIPNKNLPGLK